MFPRTSLWSALSLIGSLAWSVVGPISLPDRSALLKGTNPIQNLKSGHDYPETAHDRAHYGTREPPRCLAKWKRRGLVDLGPTGR
jgi:hypothetical protein